jgi:hypothetical protein
VRALKVLNHYCDPLEQFDAGGEAGTAIETKGGSRPMSVKVAKVTSGSFHLCVMFSSCDTLVGGKISRARKSGGYLAVLRTDLCQGFGHPNPVAGVGTSTACVRFLKDHRGGT